MKYWPFERPFVPLMTKTGAPIDQSASFKPDIGVPITRPRATAQLEVWTLSVVFEGEKAWNDFEDWFREDLVQGTQPFVWRHPVRGNVVRCRFDPCTYSPTFLGAGNVLVGFSALILPGRLWFAPYVPKCSARPPDWVADYAAGRYWIGQSEVSASALSGVSGAHLVLEQRLQFTQRFFTATYTGNVPQSAPSGVDWLAGFAQ